MAAEVIEVERRVLAESRRFRAQLPDLMLAYADRWVVFFGGVVLSVHDSEEDAYLAGLQNPGPGSGHVIVQVRPPEDVFVGALWSGSSCSR